MQDEFTYSPDEMEGIRQSLSRERLGSYMALAANDLREAIRLYERNTSLSEALYGLLQGFEIALRNAMHQTLALGLGREDWYDSMIWQVAQQSQIANAKEGLQKKAKPVTPGRMVAELSLGFWVGLTGPKYSVNLWEQHLYKAFPNARLGRKQLNKRLESIRILRNRVAHHEPILSRDLEKDVDRILETIGWISRDTEQWIRQTNCFHERFFNRREPTMPSLWAKTRTTLEMIKWEHSIFALPFALTAVLLAAVGLPGWRLVLPMKLVWILVAMVAARSSAMAFNRWADAELDAANPRTKSRAIPAGLLTRQFVLGFTLLAAAVFVAAAAELNRLTLYLTPLVLLVLWGYSYLKRITRWSHLGLGLALGLAPSAAWIAVRGSLDARILVLTAAVTLWAGGFDVLYACQDFEHDRAAGLHSLPQAVGIPAAFWTARAMHLLMLGLLVCFGALFHFHALGWLGIVAVGLLLAYEHSLVSPRDLRRLNAAFFTMNGVIAMVFLAFVASDLWLQ